MKIWCAPILLLALSACSEKDLARSSPSARNDVALETGGPAPAAVGRQSAPAGTAEAGAAQTDARIDRVLGHHAAYRSAFDRLQTAVAHHDAMGVAQLVRYPLQAHTREGIVRIDDAQGFVARYDDIIQTVLFKAIVDARYGDLFVSQNGVMIGSGQAWLTGVCQDTDCVGVDVKLSALQPGD